MWAVWLFAVHVAKIAGVGMCTDQCVGVQVTVFTLVEKHPPSQAVSECALSLLHWCGGVGKCVTLESYAYVVSAALCNYHPRALAQETESMTPL